MTPHSAGSPVLVSSVTDTAQDILAIPAWGGSIWFSSNFWDWTTPYTVPDTWVSKVAPDSAGGILLIVNRQSPLRNQGTEQSLVRVADGSVQYGTPIPGPGWLSDLTVTDDGLTLFSSGSDRVTAFEPVSGAVSWSVDTYPHRPLGDLLSTTDNGGALYRYWDFDEFGAPYWALTEIDGSGAVLEPQPIPGDWDLVGYGQLLNRSELLIQEYDYSSFALIALNLDVAPGRAMPTPYGSGYGQIAKAIIVREHLQPDEVKGATGYDPDALALMVPIPPHGSKDVRVSENLVLVRVPRGRTVTFAPADASVVSIQPTEVTGDGNFRELTFRGLKAGTTRIDVFDAGVFFEWVLYVDVKEHRLINVKLVEVTDTERAPRHSPRPWRRLDPDPSRLQAELDTIFPGQTNVRFTVGSVVGVLKSKYDTKPMDGRLELPSKDRVEVDQILADLAAANLAPDDTNWTVSYVYEINNSRNPDGTKLATEIIGGFATARSPGRGIFLATDWPQDARNGHIDSTTAHELGHVLGRGGTFEIPGKPDIRTEPHAVRRRCSGCLMLPSHHWSSAAPRRLTRDDWNTMNFVIGSPVPERKPQ